MKKKKYIFIFLGFLILCSIAACNLSSANKKDKITTEKDSNITTIKWCTFPVFSSDGSYEKSLIKEFENENSEIKVELDLIDYSSGPEKINVSINNDSMYDVLFDAPGRIISYGKSGYLVDLSDMFSDEFIEDVGNENLLNSCKDEETPYLYPISSAPFYMVFNKGMLEEAGVLSLVKEGWTTDDFITVLTALKEKHFKPGSFFCKDSGGDQATRALVANLYSSHIVNSDLSEYIINDENGKKAVALINKLIEDGCLVDGNMQNGTEDISDFTNGESSFSILWGPNQYNTYFDKLKSNNIEIVEVPYPSNDGVPELEYLVNGFCIFNTKNEKKIEASKKLIKFICDKEKYGIESVKKTGCIPVRKSFGEIYSDDRMKEIEKWSKYYSTYYNTISGFADMRILWYQSMKSLVISHIDSDEILDNFVSRANETIR